jgi:hypothetical protein
MGQNTAERRIVYMDLDDTWHLLGRVASGESRHTYFQYGAGRQRTLIVLHGLRREQVVHNYVRVRVEDDSWGPVVQVLEVVKEVEGLATTVWRVSAVIREAHARRGGSRRGRPYRQSPR